MSAKGHKRTSFEASGQEVFYRNGIELPLTLDCWRYFKRGGPPPYARLQVRKMGSKMKNQIVAAFIVGGANETLPVPNSSKRKALFAAIMTT